jgi:hypothetical protein
VGILGKVVEEHHDVLQNIESVILGVHRKKPDLVDYDVEGALEALVADYTAEQRGNTPREHRLDGARAEVYRVVRHVCEWRMGRDTCNGEFLEDDERATPEIIVSCLKKIRKSVRRWNIEGGRQGYLRLIAQYIP